jgi:hypothetical protein
LEYIAGCNFIEESREFKVGQKVVGISPERLEYLSKLPGWKGNKMVIPVGQDLSVPENKLASPSEVKLNEQVQLKPSIEEPQEVEEDDEILQKASLKVLRQFARQEGIKGSTKMGKEELIEVLKKKQED